MFERGKEPVTAISVSRSIVAIVASALYFVCLLDTAQAQVVLNEIVAINNDSLSDDNGESPDWIELLNTGNEPVDLFHYAVSDDPLNVFKWRLPEWILGPGEFVTLWASGEDRTVPSETLVTRANSPLKFTPTILTLEQDWRYLVGSPEEEGPPEAWMQPDFDDADWPVGKPGFGFGDDDDRTVLPEDIGAVFLRTEIHIESLEDVEDLILQIWYDDGFVFFINGEHAMSRFQRPNQPLTFASTSRTSHEARTAQRFIVSDWAEHFRIGRNVIGAAVLNRTVSSADMSFAPELGVVPPVFHTNFQIDVGDAVDLPEQRRDRSYGRFPDGTGDFAYMLIPTPDAPNDRHVSSEPLSTEITLDPPPGLYRQDTEVTLSANIPFEGFEIRFTTNGRTPRSTSTLYEGPITVTRNTVLRANGFLAGQTEPLLRPVSGSYFRSFNSLVLPVISIAMEPSDYQTVHNNSGARGPASERAGHFEVISIDGEQHASTSFGLRLHGGAGRNGGFTTKKAYKAYFRGRYGDTRLRFGIIPDTHLQSFDKLVLRSNFNDAFRTGQDASLIRDQVIRDVHKDMGQIISHGSWYNMFVNMRYRGVFNVVERMDKKFFASYFPDIGEEWDVIKTGNDVLDGTSSEFTRMLNFFRTNSMREPENYEEGAKLLDIEDYTSYMLLNIWAQNHDWPHNNWYAARPRIEGGKWIFLSWDAEFGMSRSPGGYTSDTLTHALSRSTSSVAIPLFALIQSPIYGEFFLNKVEEYVAGPLSPENVLRHVQRHAGAIRTDMPEEAAATAGNLNRWEQNIRTVQTFAQRRPAVFRNFCFNSSRIPNPRAASGSPSRVDIGEDLELTLRGIRFVNDMRVYLNGEETEILNFNSSRQVTVAVPADLSLEGPIDVRVESDTTGGFTSRGLVTGRVDRPSITSITPQTGPASGGNTIQVRGDRFGETTRIEFGGVPSPSVRPVGDDGEVLNVTVPAGRGRVSVIAINDGAIAVPSLEEISYVYEGGKAPSFLRGDCDGDDRLTVSDAVCALGHLFHGVDTLQCQSAIDTNDDGVANLSDVIHGLSFLFRKGDAPAAPFPNCGNDTTPDELTCDRETCN